MNWFQLGILGVTRSGKSYLTSEIVNHLAKIETRIIIIDDLNQISNKLNDDFTICISLEQFIYHLLDKEKFSIIVSLEDDSEYVDVFNIIWRLNNLILVIDELSLFCDPFNLPESLRHLTQRGRLKNISLIWNTQRPANISRNISSQNEFVISFALYELADLKFFYLDKEKAEKIQALDIERHEYLLARGSEKQISKRLNNFKFNFTF